MKTVSIVSKNKGRLKVALVLAALALWVSIPFVTETAKAGNALFSDDIERWAVLVPPGGNSSRVRYRGI